MNSVETAQKIKDMYGNLDTEQQEHFAGVKYRGKDMDWMPEDSIEDYLLEQEEIREEDEIDNKLAKKARRGGY